MRQRLDARIYRESERELREKHKEEFEKIRKRRLEEAGVEVNSPHNQKDQELVYDYIVKFYKKYDYTPTVGIIGSTLDLGRETVRAILQSLVYEDKIVKYDTRSTKKGRGNYELTTEMEVI